MPLLSYAEALGTDLPVTSGKPASKHVLSNTEGTGWLAIFATFLIPIPSVGADPTAHSMSYKPEEKFQSRLTLIPAPHSPYYDENWN